MTTATKTAPKKTREKLAPKQKRCFGCKQIKHKFKDFKPRWGRCEKHKEQGKPFSEKCKGCAEARGSNIRQPRCVGCDAKRTKKEAPAKAKATKKKQVATAATVEVPAPQVAVAPAPVAVVAPVVVTPPVAPVAVGKSVV